MKQRLLLALLMVFASVGLVRAESVPISIVIKAGEKATITFQNEGKGFVAPDKSDKSYPIINGQTPTVKDASTAVYTVEAGKDADLSLSLATDYAEKWKSVVIVLDGKVKEFTINKDVTTAIAEGNSPLLAHITSIEFKNNGETLEALKLGTNSWKTDYMPELGALTVPDSKLTIVPAKTDKMSASTYSIGKVPYGPTTEYAGGGENQTARSFLLLPSGLFASVHTYLKDIVEQNDLQIVALKDAEGNDITAYATDEGNWDQAKAFYHFRNANGVYDKYGVFTADIKILNDSYPGVILTGVKLDVQQAKFKLTIDNPDASKVAVSAMSNGETINTNSTLVYGQPFTLSAISQTGYQFAGFEVEGATATGHEGDSYNFTVDGDNDITIKVKSEAASNKIVFEQDPAGTLEVLSDKGRLTTGSPITTGEELTIKAEAKEGFEIEQVTINGTPIAGSLSKEKNSFEGETIVPAVDKGKDVIIKVTYKAKAYRLTIVRPSAATGGELSYFGIKDKSNGKDIAVNDAGAANILAGTQLEITIKLKDANVGNNITAQINGEKQTFRKDGEGTYIIDYTMPSRSAKLVVDYTALKKITVELDEKVLAYDGTNQQVAYTTNPKNVQGITVEYANSSDATEWSTTAYETIGTHYVRFIRKADDHYQAMDGKSPDYVKSYEIKGTQLVITALPTVKVVEKDGTTTYEITGGQVGYQRGDATYTMTEDEMVKAGKFELVGTFDATAKSVKVKFITNADNKAVSSSDEANVALVDKDGNVAEIQVEINAKSDPGLVLMNGGAEVHSGNKLADGTKITFSVKDSYPTNDKYYHEVYRVDDAGNEIKQADVWDNNQGYTINLDGNEKGRELLSFKLKTTDNRIQPVLDTNKSKLTQYVIYNGDVKPFNITDSLVWNNGNEGSQIDKKTEEGQILYTTDDNGWWSITYKQGSTIVPEPIDVGEYDVVLERKEGGTYKAIAPFTAKLIILPAPFDQSGVNKDIKATAIGAGSPLSDSELSGTPNIAGHYEWAVDIPSVNETDDYAVKFVPADPNYAPATLKDVTVTVEVNDKYTLNYSNPDGLGLIEVSDAYGIVPDGSTLRKGTKLYLTAVPKDATKVRLASISGVSISAKDEGVIKAEFTFTGKMNIVANFSVIEPEVPDPEPSDPVIDEDSQYIVTVKKASTNNRGFILGKEGENGVKFDNPFEFTVNALDADLDKLVVTGATKVSKGKYRIESVTANTTVTVSLPNPTPIDVKVVTESKNAKGYLMGKVKAESYPLDGKCYYGDELVVVAYPESGVSFSYWKDNALNKDQMREIVVTKAMTIEAVFSGVPTGIEDIESASIYAGDGYIQVKNVANADLTIVSISGRIQTRQHLDGDVQVRVPAGVYVVVLESGQDVKRVKVIVR